MRQPPENSESVRFCAASSKPRPARMRAARAGAACASMSASRVWISSIRIGSLAAGGLLLHAADTRKLRDRDRARFRLDLAADQAEQRGLAGAVASDQPDPRA